MHVRNGRVVGECSHMGGWGGLFTCQRGSPFHRTVQVCTLRCEGSLAHVVF